MSVLSSLTNRIFLASAALVVVAIGVAAYRVNVSVTSQAERELRTGLDEAASLVDDFSRARFDGFAREAGLIADLPNLKNAVLTGDATTASAMASNILEVRATVQPIAAEYQREIAADLLVVLDRFDRVLARSGRIDSTRASIDDILRARPATHPARWLFAYDGGVLQIAAIPMEPGPAVIGVLLVGIGFDQDAALRIKTLSNSDIVLASNSRVVVSTLPAGMAEGLEAFVGRHDIFETRLGTEDVIARVQPFDPQAPPGVPVAIVLRSRTERLAFLAQLRRDIGVTGLFAVLLATVAGYLIARTVTRPLRALTATMTEMAATGDIARTVPPSGPWDDEDARVLADTFRGLTTAIDRFQQDATQRERLSALGRLSTVIAHEVRNPLMIIKTAVHALRRTPSSADITTAAASIEEEVSRLNGVVSDVLDFARPITCEWAQADLVAIAGAAADAARAGAGDVPITVESRTPAATLVTDSERLRSVLVNLLTNAQHAVRARRAGRDDSSAPDPTPIRVVIRAVADSRWEIAVVDTGIGIPAADLPQVFEPFFTTRRTGSGLGLAISRNIVESLGGVIAIDSRAGSGTTVRIELRSRAAEPAR